MTFITISFFISFCGLLGIFLRRNLLNTTVSLLQITIGINGLIGYITSSNKHFFAVYLVLFLIFVFIIFLSAIAMLLIKRRSTLNVNELTELRG